MKILLIDDHAVVRRGVRALLADEYPDAEFKEASNATEALHAIRKQRWDLLMLDISLPGRGGIDLLAEIRVARPEVAVIMLSMHPETEFAVRALKAGAAGYLTKQSADEELLNAVRKVLSGGRYITAKVADKLADLVAGASSDTPHARLSDREFQIMQLLAGGKTVKEIAADLSLSAKTVSTYRSRVLEKLELGSTAELARYADRHQLIE